MFSWVLLWDVRNAVAVRTCDGHRFQSKAIPLDSEQGGFAERRSLRLHLLSAWKQMVWTQILCRKELEEQPAGALWKMITDHPVSG